MPVLTQRAVLLTVLGLLPALLAVVTPGLWAVALAVDVGIAAACVYDALRAPSSRALRVSRHVEPVLSAGARNAVSIELERASGFNGRLRGELRDTVESGPLTHRSRQPFELNERLTVQWHLTPNKRGDLQFGDMYLRVWGPWGLCGRQVRIEARQTVKVYPDLRALKLDALSLARAADDSSRRPTRRISEGRELDSLREYHPGDDRRTMDWKATARRGKPMVRVFRPERNQTVLLLIDCGRHMAGVLAGRRKVDHAVDAALRLAKVSLEQSDQVGVMAFGSKVEHWLPPRKGADHLQAIAATLYRTEATLTESDYGQAIDLAFARSSRRALVVVLTDVTEPDASSALLRRTAMLVPRHLPLIASLVDDELLAVASSVPTTPRQTYERQVAARLEQDYRLTAARLREAGAHVIRAQAGSFGPQMVNTYLQLKARGAL